MRMVFIVFGGLALWWAVTLAFADDAQACCHHYCQGYNYEPYLPDSCSTFDCHLHYNAPAPYATIGPAVNREVVYDQGMTVVARVVREDDESYFSRAYRTLHYTADRFFIGMTASALVGAAIAAFFTLKRMKGERRS